MEVREQRMWQSILDALDKSIESKVWIIMMVGTNDYTWYYTIVELSDCTPYKELEDKAAKVVKSKLQEHDIYPSFIKMKSITHNREEVHSMLRAKAS